MENKKSFLILIKNSKGLSLIEILISLTLLAIAGTFITGKVLDSLHEGKVSSAKIQMNNLAERLKDFKRHCGNYPTTEQGLDALVEKPAGGTECPRYAPGGYIEGGKVPQDPWDHDFYYESDGKDFNIISYGSDGQEGGEKEDADISFKDKK
ncbi:MAG: type II secretion system major pseudopilin GspG [Bacteriovoracaceae bacterium]